MKKRKISKGKHPPRPINKKKYPGESDSNAFVRVASKHVRETNEARDRILSTDAHLAVLDSALTSAEEHLRKLLPEFQPYAVAVAFEGHVCRHLNVELSNIAAHGHVNDDPADAPKPTDADLSENGKPGVAEANARLIAQAPAMQGKLAQITDIIVNHYGEEDEPFSKNSLKQILDSIVEIMDAKEVPSTSTPNNKAKFAEFVALVARMKTEKEFGDNPPDTEDWISTLNNLIAEARTILPGVGPDLDSYESENI
jgi:hypothetical protein